MNAETAVKAESYEFQAEVSQLLNLMIHSLYSNKEIFLRELISNASDACDKLRFEALKNDALFEGDSDLKIHVNFDKEAGTVTVSDNGIGMTRDEVMANIGTIARSGTKEFLSSLTGDQARDAQMIGQFGVGFYSSFIVADKVTVVTRKAGEKDAVRWESAGTGTYSLDAGERGQHGTDVILHLRKDEDEFLDSWRLRGIIRKYSDHISLPIMMPKDRVDDEEKDKKDKNDEAPEYEQVNNTTALWARPKKDIADEDYKEFYKTIAHDFQEPLAWTHNRVEGKQEYISLLYIPSRAPFDLWDREHAHGVKLYVKRVFIMDDSEQLMPRYLRFVRGLVDSKDLPLNVSREILQSNKLIDGIRSGSVKKILGMLESMAKDKPEDYAKFWSTFGNVLKEGLAEDFTNREQIAKLFRFASTREDSPNQALSLDDYIGRMKDGQDKIYYLTADSYKAAANSPHLEVFRKRGIEVILMYDRVDEWMMQYLHEYAGKKLVSVAKGDLELDALGSEEEKKQAEEVKEAAKDVVERFKKALENNVEDVRATTRLTDSPACVVLKEFDMALHMQRLMKQAGHDVPASKPILEINPTHPLVKKIEAEQDETRFKEWSELLLNQAILAEGGQLEDPAAFVRRLNRFLAEIQS